MTTISASTYADLCTGVCEALGINPRESRRITLGMDGIDVEVMCRDLDGHHVIDYDANRVVSKVIHLAIE